jgi:MFS transporter, SHS family, lactate transporter
MLSHTTRHTWRTLFWTTACISAFAAIIRAFLFIPESKVFLRAKEQQRALGGSTGGKTKVFIHRVQTMLKTHWGRCVYAILLMAMPEDAERTKLRCGTGFNFLSHGSQDLYPTYLQTTKGFDSDRNDSIVATIIGNVGAITCVSFFIHAYSFPLLSTVVGPLQALFRSISAAGSRLFCSLY